MKRDFTSFYFEKLDYLMKKNIQECIKGLRQQDFKEAQKETGEYIKNSNKKIKD